VVARHGEDGRAEALQERRRPLVLIRPSAVRQVTRRDDERRLDRRHQLAESRLHGPLVAGADVQVGEVDQPDWHDRSTLYTQIE
jgi:hypothetical protein